MRFLYIIALAPTSLVHFSNVAENSATGSSGESNLSCDTTFAVDGDKVVLRSPLAVDGGVTCTGTHEVTASDVDNLERESTATVNAVDVYEYIVRATATTSVALEQVNKFETMYSYLEV